LQRFGRGTLFPLNQSQIANCTRHSERMKPRPSVQKLLNYEKQIPDAFARSMTLG
jgi:hypothetical protein